MFLENSTLSRLGFLFETISVFQFINLQSWTLLTLPV